MSCPGRFSTARPPATPYVPLLQSALRELDAVFHWERANLKTTRLEARLSRVGKLPTQELLQRLGSPEKQFNCIHVTGSKGKGTVASLISAGLQQKPFVVSKLSSPPAPVGLFASPHVERFPERVRINGIPIADHEIATALHDTLRERLEPPSLVTAGWFDIVTAAGFLALNRAGVVRAVIEVGLGGRADSTNVLSAPVVAVTNVFNEHADLIGPTIRDIAHEKAGIISARAHAVIGLSEAHELAGIFEHQAHRLSPRPQLEFCPAEKEDDFKTTNVRLARASLRAIAAAEGIAAADNDAILPDCLVKQVFDNLPARQEMFQVGGGSLGVILDGAHVPESVIGVLDESPWMYPVVVVGTSEDKNVNEIGRLVGRNARHVIATEVANEGPYTDAKKMHAAVKNGNDVPCSVATSPEEALNVALRVAGETGTGVIVLGSLHLAGRLRPMLCNLSQPGSGLA